MANIQNVRFDPKLTFRLLYPVLRRRSDHRRRRGKRAVDRNDFAEGAACPTQSPDTFCVPLSGTLDFLPIGRGHKCSPRTPSRRLSAH